MLTSVCLLAANFFWFRLPIESKLREVTINSRGIVCCALKIIHRQNATTSPPLEKPQRCPKGLIMILVVDNLMVFFLFPDLFWMRHSVPCQWIGRSHRVLCSCGRGPCCDVGPDYRHDDSWWSGQRQDRAAGHLLAAGNLHHTCGGGRVRDRRIWLSWRVWSRAGGRINRLSKVGGRYSFNKDTASCKI